MLMGQAIAKVGQSHVGATASVAREVGNKGTAGDRGGRPYRDKYRRTAEKNREESRGTVHLLGT